MRDNSSDGGFDLSAHDGDRHGSTPEVQSHGGVLKIGLLWHSANSGNLGVGALTVANLALARETAISMGFLPKFTIIGMRDSGVSFLSPDDADVVTVDTRSLLSPTGSWKVLGQQDCVLDIGLGDSFADIYGFKRFLFLWLTKIQCVLQGIPLMLSPQTLGPFTRKLYRPMARMVLNASKLVVARDDVSLEALRNLAPSAKGALAVDVAFALPYEDRSAARGGARIRVGVNVSGLLFQDAENGTNRFGMAVNYADLMRRFIGSLVNDPSVEVHLICHVAGNWEGSDNDGPIADILAREFPSTIRVPNFRGPSDAKSYISSLDFLVAGRMHACIAAYSSGVPVVPVAYSRKFSGLFGMLGYKWLVPVQGVDTEGALTFLSSSIRDREKLAGDIKIGMTKVSSLLDVYRLAMRQFFSNAEIKV